MMKQWRAWAASALAVWSAGTQAAPVTIDFEDQPYTSVAASNVEIQGLRFSPDCHYDIWTWAGGGNFMGFDASACVVGDGGAVNPNYLGPAPLPASASRPSLYVDAGGNLFDVLEVTNAASQWSAISSNGGYISTFTTVSLPIGHVFALTGPQWERVSWILFYSPGAGMPVGFDNLVVSIPEPSAAWLALIGIGAAIAARRSRPA